MERRYPQPEWWRERNRRYVSPAAINDAFRRIMCDIRRAGDGNAS